MKRFTFLAAILATLPLLLAACGANNNDSAAQDDITNVAAVESASDAGDFIAYDNPINGISLQYPEAWTVIDEGGAALTLGSHASLATGDTPNEPYGIFLVSVSGRGIAGLSANPTAGDMVAYLNQRFTEFGLAPEDIVSEPGEVVVAGKPGAAGTVNVDGGGNSLVQNTFTVFVDGDRLVTTISVAPVTGVDEMSSFFSTINETINVTAPDLVLVEGAEIQEGLGRDHGEAPTYPEERLPPIGGIHHPVWQNCGIYDEAIESKNAVHSMEHGAVWITYDPDLPEAEIEALRVASRGQPYVLMSPFPNLRSPVVMNAWSVRLELDSATDVRVASFIEAYQSGPQTPEPGATCQSGIGNPVDG